MEFRKTYLSTSLRIPFTKQSFSTYFIKYNNIFIQLKRAKIENRFEANRYFFSILCVSSHQLLLMGIKICSFGCYRSAICSINIIF